MLLFIDGDDLLFLLLPPPFISTWCSVAICCICVIENQQATGENK